MKNNEPWQGLKVCWGRMAAWRKRASLRLGSGVAMLLVGVALALAASGNATTLTISGASVTITGPTPATLNFPVARSGDSSYAAAANYQTENGTALTGTDYTAASGALVIPAGTTSAKFP